MKGCVQKERCGEIGGALFNVQRSPKSNLVLYWIGIDLDVE